MENVVVWVQTTVANERSNVKGHSSVLLAHDASRMAVFSGGFFRIQRSLWLRSVCVAFVQATSHVDDDDGDDDQDDDLFCDFL